MNPSNNFMKRIMMMVFPISIGFHSYVNKEEESPHCLNDGNFSVKPISSYIYPHGSYNGAEWICE